VVRRHDHLGGWCVTELTDVPWELNGLFDLERRPKPQAVAELARVSQPVLPMLELYSLAVAAGGRLTAPVHVANDGPPLEDVRVAVGLAGEAVEIEVPEVSGWSVAAAGTVDLPVPSAPGPYEVSLRLLAADREVAANTYPIRAVAPPPVDSPEHPSRWSATLPHRGSGLAGRVFSPSPGVMVVGDGALDAEVGEQVRERLAAGETVVVLAQELVAVEWYPVTVEMAEVATAWGSTVFHFTCDQQVLASLPERAVLAGEDATVVPTHLLTRVGDRTWPETTVVGAFKPVPDPLAGPVVGALPVGGGRLVTCQYRLAEPARRGDPAARAILAELLRWAAGGAR
jgi:hypothetical protein